MGSQTMLGPIRVCINAFRCSHRINPRLERWLSSLFWVDYTMTIGVRLDHFAAG